MNHLDAKGVFMADTICLRIAGDALLVYKTTMRMNAKKIMKSIKKMKNLKWRML